MIRFLLHSGADARAREPLRQYTLLMEAAAAGHEIIGIEGWNDPWILEFIGILTRIL